MADHPWIENDPDGVRWDAVLPLVPVQQLLDAAVKRWPGNPAIEFMGRTLDYRELGELARRAAKGFQQIGVGPGVHVGLYLPNTPQYPIAFFGAHKAGGTVVNYSRLDAERVLAHKIEGSETDVLVSLDLAALYLLMARQLARPAQRNSRLKKLVVGNFADKAANAPAVRAHMHAAGQLAPVAVDKQHLSFEQLLSNDAAYESNALGDLRQAIVVLQYTDGTTGLPKGAMRDPREPERGLRAVPRHLARQPARADRRHRARARGPAAVPHLCIDREPALRRAPRRTLMVLHPRFDVDTVITGAHER